MSRIGENQLNQLAKQLLHDYDLRNPGTAFESGLVLGLEDAWRLQNTVADLREARGEKVVGYKIGCVSEQNQKMMGLTHPVWGRLWSTEQYDDQIELSRSIFANLAVEAEFALTLSHAIEPNNKDNALIAQSVESIFPVLELHNLILRGDPPNGHELIANNAIHAGVVSGKRIANPQTALETNLELVYDGTTIDSWSGIRWPTDFLSPVCWLVSNLGREGRQLKEGDTILIGALGPPLAVENVQRVEVRSSAFGAVGATFA